MPDTTLYSSPAAGNATGHLHSASTRLRTLALVGAVLTISLTGCKYMPWPANDAQLTSKIQTTLAADSAIAGQPVTVSVQSGVATLSGTVANDAQRTLAARDAAGISGVKQVVNTISVGTPDTAAVAGASEVPAPSAPQPAASSDNNYVAPKPPKPHQTAPIERQQAYNPPPPPPQPQPIPQPQPQPQPQPVPPLAPAPPPPPPAPTYKTVTVATGDTIPVRITQTLDSATTQQGTTFSGVVASDIVIDGLVAIPAGSNVSGRVDAVQEAAHFKGSALLTVSLSTINRRGEHLDVTTDPYTVTGKGRGVNTAEKTGGGAAVGAILGGIFGGGKGAAIGAAAGGGVGAGSQAVTRGQQVQIASESVVRFHLASPISVKVRTDGGEKRGDDGGLQTHPNQ